MNRDVDVAAIEEVVLKPQNLYLIADGKATLDLTPMIYMKSGKGKVLLLRSRINDSFLEYVCEDLHGGVTRFFSTNDESLAGKQIEIKVKIKGTDKVSAPVKINIVKNVCKNYEDIVYPVVFHIFLEEGQEDKMGVYFGKDLFDDILNKWNNVFSGKVTNDPAGTDTHIRFRPAKYGIDGTKLESPGINKIILPPGTFSKTTNIYELISRNNALWDDSKYLNVWIDGNRAQEASDELSSLCVPLSKEKNLIQGIDSLPNPKESLMRGLHSGILFKADEIKQLNKKYSTFYGYKPGYNEMIHYLGIYMGLHKNNIFGSMLLPQQQNIDGEDYCADTQAYHKDEKYYKSNETLYKENENCFFRSDNIMDDPTGFHVSVSMEQAVRMRWVALHCHNRQAWKSDFAFKGGN